MKGVEAHFCGRLSRDAEQRTTKSGKPMVVLQVAVNDPGTDEAVWINTLAFEDLAQQMAGLPKGTEVYAKGRLKVGLYQPEGGDPRLSLTLLASHVEPMMLERKPPRTARPAASSRPAVVYGDGGGRKGSSPTGADARAEDFNDDL